MRGRERVGRGMYIISRTIKKVTMILDSAKAIVTYDKMTHFYNLLSF